MSAEQSTVEYRDVLGFPGYRVGNDGTVWSKRIPLSKWKDGTSVWKLLKFGYNKGHPRVGLIKTGVAKVHTISVHTLVLEAFVCSRPPGMQCCHRDGNPANNNPANLYWGSAKQNKSDSFRHGTVAIGERNGAAVLTEELVAQMRQARLAGSSYRELRKQFGVSHGTVSNTIRKKHWKHVA